jgi:hypothetical protein
VLLSCSFLAVAIAVFAFQTFHDNSDFAPIAKHAPPEVTELLRGEDFVAASELEDYDMPSEGYPDELVRPLFSLSPIE